MDMTPKEYQAYVKAKATQLPHRPGRACGPFWWAG